MQCWQSPARKFKEFLYQPIDQCFVLKHKIQAYFQYFCIVITLLTFHTNITLGFLHKDLLLLKLISSYHIEIALLILHPNIQWTPLHAPQGMCECEP
jgi:hypothetical protein